LPVPFRFGREPRHGQQRHGYKTHKKTQENAAEKYRVGHGSDSLSFKLLGAVSAGETLPPASVVYPGIHYITKCKSAKVPNSI
jgi:hypothetical protein